MAEIEKVVSKRNIVHMVYGESIEIIGALAVPSYDAKSVEIKLAGNELLVSGDGLEMKKIDLAEGVVLVTGRVSALKYAHAREKESLLKRLLK